MIDTGRIAESLGWNPTDLNRNQALLRVAVGMRTTAIKIGVTTISMEWSARATQRQARSTS